MLSMMTKKKATNVASIMNRHGMAFSPKTAQAYSVVRNLMGPSIEGADALEVMEANNDNPVNESSYLIDGKAKLLADALSNNILLIREHVLPLVGIVQAETEKSYISKLNEIDSQIMPAFSVDTVEFYVTEDGHVHEYLTKYASLPASDYKTTLFENAQITQEDIKTQLRRNNETGAQLFDLVESVNNSEGGVQLDWFEAVFKKGTIDENTAMNNFRAQVLIFLYAQTLVDSELPPGINADATNVRTMLLNIRNYYSKRISIYLDHYTQYKDLGYVINTTITNSEKVHVFDANFKKLNEETNGHAADIVIGSHLLGSKHVTINALIENQQQCYDAYARLIEQKNNARQNLDIEFFVKSVYDAIVFAVNSRYDSMQIQVGNIQVRLELDQTKYTQNFEQYRQGRGRLTAEHLMDYCVWAVCKNLFDNKLIFEYITKMNELREQNDQMSLNEAAYLVTAEVVAKSLIQEFEVTYIGNQ